MIREADIPSTVVVFVVLLLFILRIGWPIEVFFFLNQKCRERVQSRTSWGGTREYFCGGARGGRGKQTRGMILQKRGHRERPQRALIFVRLPPFPVTTPRPSIQSWMTTSTFWARLVRQASVKLISLTWIGRHNTTTNKPVRPTPDPTYITDRTRTVSGCCMRYSARKAPASHTRQTMTSLWWGYTITVDLFPEIIYFLCTNERPLSQQMTCY